MKFRHASLPLLLSTAIGCAGAGTTDSTSTNPTSGQVASAVSTTALSLNDLALALEPIGYANQAVSSPATSSTPAITVTGAGTDSTSVKVDYGTGTTSGTNTQTGSVTISYVASAQTASIALNNYIVNSEAVNGTFTFSNFSATPSQVQYAVTANLSTSRGSYNASVGVVQAGGQTTLNGTVRATLGGLPGYNLTLSNLGFNYGANHNWVPTGGAATISYPYTLSSGKSFTANIGLGFSSSSPANRKIGVSVNGGPSVSTDLPTY